MDRSTSCQPMTKRHLKSIVDVLRDCISGFGLTKEAAEQLLAREAELRQLVSPIITRLSGTQPLVRLTRRQLLHLCREAGIDLKGGNPKSADWGGQQIPLVGELPELLFDLDELMRRYRRTGESPFGLDYDQMMTTGGGLCSAEETIQFLRIYYVAHGRLPQTPGRLRCRNHVSGDKSKSLCVEWSESFGINVYAAACESQDKWFGGLLLKSTTP